MNLHHSDVRMMHQADFAKINGNTLSTSCRENLSAIQIRLVIEIDLDRRQILMKVGIFIYDI